MSIFVIGINHKTAPIELREKIYFSFEKLALYLQDLLSRDGVSEAVIISTCNRSEIYCSAEDIYPVKEWFFTQAVGLCKELDAASYVYQNEVAIAHIMQVACGLDSMVLGESQILGQLKAAFAESCSAGAIGPLFHRLFQQVFSIAKEIRTTTAIGACPVSVASAATHFAKQQFPEFSAANIVLVGAGETTALLMRYLHTQLMKPMTIVNRSVEKAEFLVTECGGRVCSFESLSLALITADVVFSATGSATPIINKEMMMTVMQMRPTRPIILIDVAVPRDIAANVAELAGVKLFCIDDLKGMIAKNRQGREHAAEKARELIRQKSGEFIAEVKLHDNITHTIRVYRQQIEELCRLELNKSKQQLLQGRDPDQVLETFAQAFTKKLLHIPSVQLRQAGVEGRFEVLRFAKQLFAIPDPEAEML